MEISFVKYLKGDVTFADAILELKGSIQYIRKRTFIEIIFLKKPQHNNFRVKGHFFLEISE